MFNILQKPGFFPSVSPGSLSRGYEVFLWNSYTVVTFRTIWMFHKVERAGKVKIIGLYCLVCGVVGK